MAGGIELKATLDVAALRGNLDGLRDRDINFATARAVTETAASVAYHTPQELFPRIFDRPTPYTMRSFYWRKVMSKSGQQASTTVRVGLKDSSNTGGKAIPPVNYLLPHITGGPRPLKRFEAALRAVGVLPPGMFAIPTRFAKMDAYGNMKAGELVRILSYFRAFPEQGFRANLPVTVTRGKGRRQKIMSGEQHKWGLKNGYRMFAIKTRRGNGLPPGIYQVRPTAFGTDVSQAERANRLKNVPKNFRDRHMRQITQAKFKGQGFNPQPILLFIRQPTYRKRFPFFEEVERRVLATFPGMFEQWMEKTLVLARARGWIT